jgi:hypothetical protein
MTNFNEMKNHMTPVLIAMTLLLASCTSGQNSPVDSHPSSGSVKAGRTDKEKTEKDTSKADSLTKTSAKPQ